MAKSVIQQNETFWDQQALHQQPWYVPVSPQVIAEARQGKWNIHVTKKPIPEDWLPKNIKGKNILCLAAAGGQQAPVLAAAGARVIVYDLSEGQLVQDRHVAERDQLDLEIIKGDMRYLSVLKQESFDYVIHPISNLYVPDIKPVWTETYRVLKKNGILISSFYNPILFIFEKDRSLSSKGLLKPRYRIPYSDVKDMEKRAFQEKVSKGEALIFGHSLEEQLKGQTDAGFMLGGLYEDEHPTPRFLIEKYMPTMIATKAIKL